MRTTDPVFIVGTGRCGSTMISEMVRRHPNLLSVSEFFSSLSTGAFLQLERRQNGAALYQRLSKTGPAVRRLFESGAMFDEFLYQCGPSMRFQKPQHVPPLLCIALPHLSADPDKLWDELSAVIRIRGKATLIEHYHFLFEWLTGRFSKDTWLERSGNSLLLIPALLRIWPSARFVHICRDGRDTAISMHKHPLFRVGARTYEVLKRLKLDPFHPFNVVGTSPWIPYFALVNSWVVPLSSYRKSGVTLPVVGEYWSGMIERGVGYLNQLGQDRVLSIRFEDIAANPEEQVSRFIRFVGPQFENEQWLEEVVKLPRRVPSRWSRLAAADQRRLTEACEPGMRLLGYEA